MAERTEDLLSVRDGDPVNVVTRDRVLSDETAGAELRRLAAMREALRSLPVVDPPKRAWHRLSAEFDDQASRRPWGWAEAAGLAFFAVVLVLIAGNFGRVWTIDEVSLTQTVATPVSVTAPVLAGADFAELIDESLRLERILSSMPQSHRLMQAGTAITIVGLEDRIAEVDAHLSMGAAAGLDAGYREVLWQDRVDLMNALVHVRYAHAQRSTF